MQENFIDYNIDFSDQSVLVGLSGGINSMAVLCWLALLPKEFKPLELHLFYAHFVEHSQGTFKFVADGIRYARKYFDTVKVKITRNSVNRYFIKNNWIPHPTKSPCSRELKIEPMQRYIEENNIDIDLIGYIREEQKRIKRQKGKANNKYYPISHFSESDCFALVKQEIGYYPFIYDIKDSSNRQVFLHNNCFSDDTKFLTKQGTKTFLETVNTEIDVLGRNGHWTNATIKHFGKQKICKLTIQRYGNVKIIETTSDHLWFVGKGYQGRKETLVTTVNLQPNDRLLTRYSHFNKNIKPSPFGIAHGITYGDGTLPKYYDEHNQSWNPPARITLCGDKNRQLLKYFNNASTREDKAGITVDCLPQYFKSLPPLTESKSYLYGWLAGYFAADGNVDERGKPSLSSANWNNLQFARDICTLLGIQTTSIGKIERLGLGKEITALYRLGFKKDNLPSDFFLIDEHKQRVINNAENATKRNALEQPKDWTVVSIEKTEKEKDVYCAVVPEGNAFVLEDNILTHNCLPCFYMASNQLEAVKEHFPGYWAKAKEVEEKTGSYWGRLPVINKCDYCLFD